jgi:hypothetical protein
VLAAFDAVADIYEELDRLQDQRMAAMQQRDGIPRICERRYETLKFKSIELLKRLHLHTARIEHLAGQLHDLNRACSAKKESCYASPRASASNARIS